MTTKPSVTFQSLILMASFFYTLNYMWNLYSGIREKFYSCLDGYSVQFSNRVSTAGKITAVSSGLIPVAPMAPVFIGGNISQCQANFSQPYRCLLMDTGALYLTSEHQQPIRACRALHTYGISVVLRHLHRHTPQHHSRESSSTAGRVVTLLA
ncbi:transmembrane protein 116-like protein [Lates japonicus]|uniref:Transmembrane protein 116-like protein n=1 Tax=Lates japonicus TaxID=270547 RepID=A0AAD3MG37_LATJO|nr:transmembrane protein 116-like protein [Lates japonicus]